MQLLADCAVTCEFSSSRILLYLLAHFQRSLGCKLGYLGILFSQVANNTGSTKRVNVISSKISTSCGSPCVRPGVSAAKCCLMTAYKLGPSNPHTFGFKICGQPRKEPIISSLDYLRGLVLTLLWTCPRATL